jgi:hypothetical protein
MAAATMTDFRRFQKNQLTGQFPTAISLFLAQKDELTLIKPASSPISASLACLQAIGCALCAIPLGNWLFMPPPSLA